MATAVDAMALLVFRAAWTADTIDAGRPPRPGKAKNGRPGTREAAMAKLAATEMAQKVIDQALQLCGARGVVSGHPVEELYREIRSLRIYEGTSEIQKLVIARELLNAEAGEAGGAA
jgi:alkylation response protein AidB-like acyl-CoA dehydrogenase